MDALAAVVDCVVVVLGFLLEVGDLGIIQRDVDFANGRVQVLAILFWDYSNIRLRYKFVISFAANGDQRRAMLLR